MPERRRLAVIFRLTSADDSPLFEAAPPLYNPGLMVAGGLPGYSVLQVPESPGTTLVVADGAYDRVLAAGLVEPVEAAARLSVNVWASGGRVPHPVIEVDRERWVVKSYRRGGWVARWNRDLYLSRGRFFREILVCVCARRAGVPTIAPVALVLKRVWPCLHRAWLVTPYVEGAANLAEVLRAWAKERAVASTAGGAPARECGRVRASAIFRRAGQAVRRMHRAGVDHQDLNLQNLLVRGSPDGPCSEILILDWDRAELRQDRRSRLFRNLLRLYRSALKLQSDPDLLAPCLRGFLRGYFHGDPAGLRCFRRYYTQRRFAEVLLHRVYWGV